jgi:hypothetical protein
MRAGHGRYCAKVALCQLRASGPVDQRQQLLYQQLLLQHYLLQRLLLL